VELAGRHRPDVVLLDLAMPLMDGLEALPRIRAASPGSRVVVLSGFESGHMGPAAQAAGADGYIQKGATPDEIAGAIARSLGQPSPTLLAEPGSPLPPPEDLSELEVLRSSLATAAHELRSPATVLVGLAQTLSRRREALDPQTVDQLLDAIVRQTHVLDRVTSDLLTSSQAERGTVAVDVKPMRLAEALEAAVLTGREYERVSVQCPGELWVCADRVRVDQMLGNLLSNAAKYGLQPIRIVATPSSGSAVVRVIDNGPGVPEGFSPRLFQQFSRASGLRASGTGLGLFVVKSLANAQGGDAWYEPAEGGSRFCFSLPLANGDESARVC
jgi:signal transduction histidine kinase